MDDVVNFGEAARLYAQNVAVVKKMQHECESQAQAFVDRLKEEVQRTVGGDRFHAPEPSRDGNSFWWIGDSEDKGGQPNVWFSQTNPVIVHPGELTLTAYPPSNATQEEKDMLASIASQPEFAEMCRQPSSNTATYSFVMTLRYNEGDSVVGIAEKIAMLLRALDDVHLAATAR